MDEVLTAKIAQEVLLLRERYDDDALNALLVAEQTRIQQEKVLTLSGQPGKALVGEFLEKFKDSLIEHREYTSATIVLLVPPTVRFLTDKGLIDPANINLSQFIVSVFVAITVGALIDAVKKRPS